MDKNKLKATMLSLMLVNALPISKNDSLKINITPKDTICEQSDNINDYYFEQLFMQGFKSYEDIYNARELEIELAPGANSKDLIWLNKCSKLRKLTLIFDDSFPLSSLDGFKSLDTLILKNKTNSSRNFLFKNNLKFINNSEKLRKLVIYDFHIETDFIENLNQIKILDLRCKKGAIVSNYSFDYTKLMFLDEIITRLPSSLAVHLDLNDIIFLKEHDVEINAYNNGNYYSAYDYLIELNNMLNKIIAKLSINLNDDEYLKVVNSIEHIIDNYYYDYDETDNYSDKMISNKYYEDGFLGRTLNSNGIICGNYAALTSAILSRLGIENAVIVEQKHAYNIIKIEDSYYYIDITYLDKAVHDKTIDIEAIDKEILDTKTSYWPVLIGCYEREKINYLDYFSKQYQEDKHLGKEEKILLASLVLTIASARLVQLNISSRRETNNIEKKLIKRMNNK